MPAPAARHDGAVTAEARAFVPTSKSRLMFFTVKILPTVAGPRSETDAHAHNTPASHPRSQRISKMMNPGVTTVTTTIYMSTKVVFCIPHGLSLCR